MDNKGLHLLRAYSVSGTIVWELPVLTHVILIATLRGRVSKYLHFTGEETEV